ncbi:MAG: hypothetical protein Q8P21_00385 [bacterium]|nr:hypothetical protein [bacterium]
MDKQLFINRNYEIRFFAILLGALSLLVIISFFLGSRVERGGASVPSESASKTFPTVALSAKAAYVYDVRTKTVLFAKNENTRLPLASVTKVMSALVARDAVPLDDTVTITSEALQAEGDSGLLRDEKWPLKRLLDFSLLSSSNDGIRAVALAAGALSKPGAPAEESLNNFVGKMNRKASELGLKNTYFWNETGLDESQIKGGAYGTARDMSILLEYILANHPDLLTATKEVSRDFRSLGDNSHEAKNTNSIANEIPGLMASKTGFTNTAGGNLVIAFDPELGRPIIVSILGSTETGRFEDARALVGATMQYLNN